MYINVHSHFSLRYGTLKPEELVALAKKNNIQELILTDINNSTGSIPFAKACMDEGIRPLVGIEFRVESRLLYIGIAQNREGFKELNEFLSWHNLNERMLPEQPWELQQVYFIYPFGYDENKLRENEYIGIRSTQLNKLFGKPLAKLRDKLLALHPVTFADEGGYQLHQYLRAIDQNTVFTKLQADHIAHADEKMISEKELINRFDQYPFIIHNTKRILASCEFTFDFKVSKNRKTFTGDSRDDGLLLEKLAMDGLEYRYGKGNRPIEKRVRHELAIIEKLGFSAYFLITWDIIRYSMSRGFYHVGRGSGANSLVAYCMRITDVDPIELDLYFERFLNPKRSSPPDFDIDYSWDERPEVLEYIFKRYGREHTALLGTISTFGTKSIYRELGKVVGLPKAEIDYFLDPSIKKTSYTPIQERMMAIGGMMADMPNQRSIHAGGILISEEPITYYTALDLPPKGLPTVQWDMYVAETVGLDKFDILSQRGIGHIKEAAQIVQQNRKINVDVHAIQNFKKDEKIKHQLESGDTIGCFYVESPAMRGLIKKLRCNDYLTLVAASSIIRPGVAQSGMMKQYISRFHHPDRIDYLHPVMKEQLEETFGVMVYQEDVMKVCHHYAGLDLSDADVLRRAMSGKYRSSTEFEKIVQRFFEGAKALGRDEETTKEVWRQVSSFAGYSFSKAHSASYAVESYQSLYLKSYFPQEFMVAVLNNYGGFYNRTLYVHEARKSGAIVHLPCVNTSIDKVCIQGSDIWLGFIGVLNLEESYIQSIPLERKQNGPYLSLEDFVKRVRIPVEQAILLIRVGALRFTGKTKKELLWEVHSYQHVKSFATTSNELFETQSKEYSLPVFSHQVEEDVFDEIELLGFPVTRTYFDLLRTKYRGDMLVKNIKEHIGKTVKMLGCFVASKSVRTSTNKTMYFGTFLDHEGDFFDTVHFPNQSQTYPFRGDGCYLILGRVVEEFDFPCIEIIKFEKLPIITDPRV